MVTLRSSGPVLYPPRSDHAFAPALVVRETGPARAAQNGRDWTRVIGRRRPPLLRY